MSQTLLELRTQIIDISGHYELVDSSYGDNGIDKYIYKAQRMLERKFNYGPAKATYATDLAAGTYMVELSDCRVVEEVWMLGTDYRSQLRKVIPSEEKSIWSGWHDCYLTKPFSSIDSGRSRFYYPTNLRRYPNSATGSGDSTTLQSYLTTSSPYDPTITGLIILPPTDIAYAIQVTGLFYNPQLNSDNDDDYNFWTYNHPDLLIMATLQMLETFYRSTGAIDKWKREIAVNIDDIDKDFVEQQISDINEMDG
jgi:hypothetical protein